jgi:hypothetical protein
MTGSLDRTQMVWPSGAASAQARVPMLSPPPGLFSTTTG